MPKSPARSLLIDAGRPGTPSADRPLVEPYLTTLGRSADQDLQMLEDLRMPVGVLSKVF